MVKIAPSILAADFTRLGEQLTAVERGGAENIHVDVMDGHFVPNISVGPFIVQAVRQATALPIDCHLMIEDPDKYIADFARAGAENDFRSSRSDLSLAPNAQFHSSIRLSRRCRPKPRNATRSALKKSSSEIDFVLVMSVNPGFGGQKFISSALDKVRRLRSMLNAHGSQAQIEIDGGITAENADDVVVAGAEILVAGSSIFGQPDPAAAVQKLRSSCNSVPSHLIKSKESVHLFSRCALRV